MLYLSLNIINDLFPFFETTIEIFTLRIDKNGYMFTCYPGHSNRVFPANHTFIVIASWCTTVHKVRYIGLAGAPNIFSISEYKWECKHVKHTF